MKNVAFISTELGVGGAEKALVEITLRMRGFGFTPTVISLKSRPASGRDVLVSKLEESQIPVRFLDVTRSTQFPGAARSLRRILDEKDAKVALSFLFHANIVTAFAAARMPRTKHLAGIRVAEPSTWRNRIEGWALRRCNGVICVSEGVKRNFARFFRDEQRLLVIPNGVAPWQDRTRVDLSTIGIGESDSVILFVGRLHPQKGLDWALPQIDRVLAQFENLHFVIVGNGPQTDVLERLALRLPSNKRIHFLGFQGDIAPYLARAQCLLLPSRWEGMPNVVLEAMAAGLPVLATHESNASELFNSECPSQLFAFGNGDEMVEKLSHLVGNAPEVQRIGAENREKSKQFSWDAIAAQYADRFGEM